MKIKLASIGVLFLSIAILAACQNSGSTAESSNSHESTTVTTSNILTTTEEIKTESENSQELEESGMQRIEMVVDGQVHPIILNDSAAARDFYSRLPFEATLEDYNRTEKIYYLPEKLDTTGAPAGMAAEAGQLNYYAPWGNICFFYKEFPFGNGLVNLGKLEEGAAPLTQYRDSFSVTFRQVTE